MTSFAESVVEDAALAWLAGLGWQIKHGPDEKTAALKRPLEQAALRRLCRERVGKT
jgi:hypothetical protein